MSKLFRLGWKDLLKGIVVAALTVVFSTLMTVLQNKGFNLNVDDLYFISTSALTAALGYLSKQLVTDEGGKLGGKI